MSITGNIRAGGRPSLSTATEALTVPPVLLACSVYTVNVEPVSAIVAWSATPVPVERHSTRAAHSPGQQRLMGVLIGHRLEAMNDRWRGQEFRRGHGWRTLDDRQHLERLCHRPGF